MSETIVRDAVDGIGAKVNTDRRQVTESVSTGSGVVSLLNGKSFALPSGLFTIVNTNEHALLYFAHSEDGEQLLGRRMILWSGKSTGGAEQSVELKFYVQSTGISGGSSFTPLSQSVGSPKQLSGDFQRGAPGATLTGGTVVTTHIVPIGAQPYILDFDALYGKDVSLGVTIVPPAGNTSLKISYIINTELINPERY